MDLAELKRLAEEYGFDTSGPYPGDWRTRPGKLEGESVDAAYFYDSMMNGDGDPVGDGEETIADVFDLTPDDRATLGDLIPDGAECAILHHSSYGFESLEYGSAADVKVWRDRIETEDDDQ